MIVIGTFLARFWRGGYSLPFSWWVVGFLVNLTTFGLLAAIRGLVQHQAFNPYVIMLALVAIWATLLAAQSFLSIGVWRSASRHRRERRIEGRWGLWALAAQLAVIVAAAGAVKVAAESALPQLREGWRMAFLNDPDTPDYSLRLMRAGTEMEISGGFKYGLARDAERLFASAPDLKVVHLNSAGGRLGEATALAAHIKARGLATYTSAACASACTIAFAAGRERWLKRGARLGFHRAIFAGTETADEMRGLLLAAGLERTFVERAVAQSATSLWFPDEQELLQAKVVSGIVDPYRFAVSGLGARPTIDGIEAALRKVGVFAALETADPALFADTAGVYRQRYLDGASEGEIVDEVRSAKVSPLLTARLATASNDILVAYALLLADQYDALNEQHSAACYEFAARAGNARTAAMLGPALQQREIELATRALQATGKRRPAPPESLREAYAAVHEALVASHGPVAVRLLAEPAKVTPGQYDLFCRLSSSMFRAIARLPALQAGDLMGSIFGSMGTAK